MFSYSTVTSVFLAVTCSRSKPPFVASAVLSLQDVFLFASQTSSFSDQSGPLSVSSHINSLRTHHTPYSETAHSCHHSNSTNSRRKHCEPLGPQAKSWGTPIAWETQKTALSPQRERRTLTGFSALHLSIITAFAQQCYLWPCTPPSPKVKGANVNMRWGSVLHMLLHPFSL